MDPEKLRSIDFITFEAEEQEHLGTAGSHRWQSNIVHIQTSEEGSAIHDRHYYERRLPNEDKQNNNFY